jgi:choline monooxygenase
MMNHPELEFDERIERAATLPARFYTDAAVLELEKRSIFYRTWQLVGRLEQVREPGSYFTAEIAGEPVIVARDRAGALRAFSNVCRHRAGPVAAGAGCRSAFQCGYHGWTYALDGRLLGTPEFEGVECFDKSEMGLIPLKVETWAQFIFVNLASSSPPLADFLADIPALTRRIAVSGMAFAERRDYVIECNWKTYVDNYLEGYHIPIVHPSLMRELDYGRYRTLTHRYYSLQDAPLRRIAEGEAGRRYEPSAQQAEAWYFWVFPNLMLNIYPDNLSTNLIVPLSESRTLTIFEWFFHDPQLAEAQEKIQQTVKFSDEIQQEDIAICEAVQRGLRSIFYDRGRYSAARENGVHHFHALWREFFLRHEGAKGTEQG